MVQGVESLIETLLHPLEAFIDSVEPRFHLAAERPEFLFHLSPDRPEFFLHLAADRFELGSHLEMQSVDLAVEVVHPVVGPALSHRLHSCTVNVATSQVAR